MSIITLLYITDVLSSLKCFLMGFVIFSGIFGVLSGFISLVGKDDLCEETYKQVKRLCKSCFITFAISGTLVTFVPSKTTMVTWIGVNTLQTVKTDVTNTELYNKVMKLLNKKVDEFLEEPKESK